MGAWDAGGAPGRVGYASDTPGRVGYAKGYAGGAVYTGEGIAGARILASMRKSPVRVRFAP